MTATGHRLWSVVTVSGCLVLLACPGKRQRMNDAADSGGSYDDGGDSYDSGDYPADSGSDWSDSGVDDSGGDDDSAGDDGGPDPYEEGACVIDHSFVLEGTAFKGYYCDEGLARNLCNDCDSEVQRSFHPASTCAQAGYPHYCTQQDQFDSGAGYGYEDPIYLSNAGCNPTLPADGGWAGDGEVCGNPGGGDSGGTGGGGQAGDPCDGPDECVAGHICFNQFCVGEGTLRITLGFTVDSDFDLHVLTPNGNEISYTNPSADGGTLDVDQCIDPCGTGSHVENVVFDGTVPAGTYQVWVVNFDGRDGGSFTIEVAGAASESFSGSLPASTEAMSEVFSFGA